MAPRGRPRQFDTEAALEAALSLFWKHGYEGVSLAALAEAMGVNMPSLYAAFGNKEALFCRVVERYLERPASYLPAALEEPTARQAAEQLFRGAIEMAANPQNGNGCLLVQGALAASPAAEPIRARLGQMRKRAEAAVRARFRRAIGDGDLPASVDAAALARYVITVIWGLSVQAAGGATRKQLEAVARIAMQAWPESQTAGLGSEDAAVTY